MPMLCEVLERFGQKLSLKVFDKYKSSKGNFSSGCGFIKVADFSDLCQ